MIKFIFTKYMLEIMSLKPEGYRPRIIDKRIADDLALFGAISIEGPKNCGKTWTARAVSNSEFQLNANNKVLATTDPSFALKGDAPHLIDEWQEVPEIWDEVRFEVDRSAAKGRFVLSASSTLKVGSKMHSGAGRIEQLIMRPMSLFESGDSDGKVSLSGMFRNEFPSIGPIQQDLKAIIGLTIRGGWPDQLGFTPEQAMRKNKDYLRHLCDEDVIRIDGKGRDSRKMMMLLRSLARNESTVASNKCIINDMAEYDNENMAAPTYSDYIDVLQRLHIVAPQDAFSVNIRSSANVGKNPKRHLIDPSLSMAALDMDEESAIKDLNAYGFMFEAMCERDLNIYSMAFDGSVKHYRDNYGHEIDAVVSLGNRWGAFEIKLGTSDIESASNKLVEMKNKILETGKSAPPEFLCVISGMSSSAYMRPDGVYVVPITMLGP